MASAYLALRKTLRYGSKGAHKDTLDADRGDEGLHIRCQAERHRVVVRKFRPGGMVTRQEIRSMQLTSVASDDDV